MNINVIEDKRRRKRITVSELCKGVGINRSTYYKYIRDPDGMRLSTWQKIVEFLGLTKEEQKQSLK